MSFRVASHCFYPCPLAPVSPHPSITSQSKPFFPHGAFLAPFAWNFFVLMPTQELDLHLEERWLVALWDFWLALNARRKEQSDHTDPAGARSWAAGSGGSLGGGSLGSRGSGISEGLGENSRSLGDLGRGLEAAEKIYVRSLQLHPIQVLFPFLSTLPS